MAGLGASGGRWLRFLPLGVAARFTVLVAIAAVSQPLSGAAQDVTPLVSPDRIEDVPSTQVDPFPAFDNFAWRAFLALNWPSLLDVDHRGEPDRARRLDEPGPRVWETFKSRHELFQIDADGRPAAPTPWESFDGRNPCGPDADNRTKTLASFTPYAEFNEPGFTLGEFLNPLVAQNRTYTRYEIRINEPEYDVIRLSGWSVGKNLPDESHAADLPIGSISVKAAWRLLTDADTPAVRARFYVARANAVDAAKSIAAGRIVCSQADVALVGLHIMIKTRYRPQWLWSTFEHVDNVPPAGKGEAREPDAKEAGFPYSYYDASDPYSRLPLLGLPQTQPISASNPPLADPSPMQVTRRHPVHSSTMAMNRAYWALPAIKGTVWEHYMLVASQWPTVTNPRGPENDGGYFPGFTVDPDKPRENYQSSGPAGDVTDNMANTTMETYLQDAPSSCMSCHAAVANARGRDFAGILSGLH
jgi:hypothetical protein